MSGQCGNLPTHQAQLRSKSQRPEACSHPAEGRFWSGPPASNGIPPHELEARCYDSATAASSGSDARPSCRWDCRSTGIFELLGNLGDFIGGIAVVVTLIYPTNQVRQNTAAMRTASREAIYAAYRAQNSHLIDPGISEAYAVGLRDFPDMPSTQKRVFTHAINDHALFFQAAFALHEAGNLPEEDYTPYLNWFSSHLATPGGSLWWRETRGFYNVALVEAVDRRFAEGPLPEVLGLGFFAIDRGEPSTPKQPTS